MGGTGDYVMLNDPHLWDNVLSRHVSSYFAVGARPIWNGTTGTIYWDANGYYDLNNLTYVGEIDDVKYWNIALPSSTIEY